MHYPKQLKIKITQEDLDLGVVHDCYRCPVARAFIREFPNVDRVSVVAKDVWLKWYDENDRLHDRIYTADEHAVEYVHNIDVDKRKVKPETLNYTLEVIDGRR